MAIHIAVIGEGRCSRRVAALAERAGAAIAAAGAVLVCGGLGGVMEAAARGAARAGGTVVGVLPGGDRAEANRWVTLPIVTGMGEARNVIVVRSADAVIGLGTWRLRQPEGRRVPIVTARSPADAVARALRAAAPSGYRKARRLRKEVQMRGGARPPHARRTPVR
jgi:uncharacterized protein (TIGR00725 family)